MALEDKRWEYKQQQLKKGVFSIMLIMEKNPIIIDADALISCYFVEDIFKNCMVGKLVFQDRYGLQEFGSFTGNEKVVIIYGVSKSDRQVVFDIWKVNKMDQMDQGARRQEASLIELTFIDTFFPALNLKKYSRSFVDEITTDSVKWILNKMVFVEDTFAQINMEDSSTRMDFVMPYWTPKVAINYLLKRSRGVTTGDSGYLYYNNTDDEKVGISINVYTMNYLLADVNKTLDPNIYVMDSKDLTYKNKILEYTMTGLDRNSNAKIRGGSWKGYNFNRKKLLRQDLEYSDAVSRTMLLGKSSLYGPIDDVSSTISFPGDMSQDILENVSYSEWCKRYNMQYIVNITVEGDESRFAGQHIQIAWPSYLKEQKFNSPLQGKYMIKSVTHHFGPGKSFPYVQRLVLIKNAYHEMNTKWLVPAVKKNIYNERTESLVRS